MKVALAPIVLAVLASQPAWSQGSPFDMSTERPAKAPASPAPPAGPARATPPVTATPAIVSPSLEPAPTDASRVPVEAAAPSRASPVEAASAQTTASTAAGFRRYLLPSDSFALSGEAASRSWAVYLTQEQAASSARFDIGYQNAVVIAPEASELRVFVNGAKIVDIPVSSSDAVTAQSFALPNGLLKAGYNDIRIVAIQRHRTDCTIASTYELWTEIDGSRTFLTFDAPDTDRLRRIDDLRAIGLGPTAKTQFNLIVPSLGQTGSNQAIAKLSQALALLASMPNQSITVSASAGAPSEPGSANILMATTTELRSMLPQLPAGVDQDGTISIVDDATFGPSTVIVGGPSWSAIEGAIDRLGAPLDRAATTQRSSIATKTWRTPDAPMLWSGTRLPFSELGVSTVEFSGRRYRTDFAVAVPADFYANAYGEAQILLDAAYSEEVLPGSHIDVYVNDSIAATVPITASGGEILRHLPIKVTMRHFKPGVNRIAVEAVLQTEADAICMPGATSIGSGRFALFDTSEFVMPDFARIAQVPNLGGLGGTGFPYGRTSIPVPVMISSADPNVLSATATLLGRMALSAGRFIPVDLNASAAAATDRNALFISPIGQTPDQAIKQVGISPESRATWSPSSNTATAQESTTDQTFDVWRERLKSSGWRGQVSSLQDWLNRTFDVSWETFRLSPAADVDYAPSNNITVAVAQQASPTENGVWTIVTAPTPALLKSGVEALSQQANWQEMGGRISAYDMALGKVDRVPVGRLELLPTQEPSFSNYRLVLANWLSDNALAYSLLLAASTISLGLATTGMLGRLGRRK